MHFLILAALLLPLTFAQNNTANLTVPNATAPLLTPPTLAAPSVNANLTAGPNATAGPQPKQPGAPGVPPPLPQQPGACARTCIRKEFRSLSPQERDAYFRAVKQLMNTPARTGTEGGRLRRRQQQPRPADGGALNGPSEYDRLVKYHIDAQKFSHGTTYFLPWHRAYLSEYERALQEIDPSVCLPYWNWSVDSQAPEESLIFTGDYLGGNGQGANNCVSDGYFAGWRPAYPEPHCLSRQYANGDQLGTFYSVEAVNRAVATIKDYNQFRKHVEGVLHPSPHNNIGGDMSTMGSPNDPIFWMHHGYVDYLWASWQRRNGFNFDGDADTPFEALTSYRGSDVLDHRQLCYQYADLQDKDLGDVDVFQRPPPPKAPAPVPPKDKLPELTTVVPSPSEDERYNPRDRTNLVAIRYVEPINEDWCRRNNIDINEVRQYETDYRGMVKELNKVKGYVSPCSLLKRPKLCAGLIKKKKVQKFCVDVENLGRVEVGYHDSVAQQDPYQAMKNVNQRVYTCSPNVERPAEEIRASVSKLTGPSAFEGAGSLKQITDIDQLHGSADAKKVGGVVMALVAMVAGLNAV